MQPSQTITPPASPTRTVPPIAPGAQLPHAIATRITAVGNPPSDTLTTSPPGPSQSDGSAALLSASISAGIAHPDGPSHADGCQVQDSTADALQQLKERRAEPNYMKDLDASISLVKGIMATDRRWHKSKAFVEIDKKYIRDLVHATNLSRPGINLSHVSSLEALRDRLPSFATRQVPSQKILIRMNTGSHTAIIDCRVIRNTLSAILFEPLAQNYINQPLLASIQPIMAEFPAVHFTALAMDIQRSSTECAIFSLQIAKKLHDGDCETAALHLQNIACKLQLGDTNYLPPATADRNLPPPLFKHTQGRQRLADYIAFKPGRASFAVNRKGDTLLSRQQRYLKDAEAYSSESDSDSDAEFESRTIKIVGSAHWKRLTELEKLKILLNSLP